MSQLLQPVAAVLTAVGGLTLLFWMLNWAVERLPGDWEHRVKPYVLLGPALALVVVILIYPAVRSVVISFFGPRSQDFVGLENYRAIATDPQMREALWNNFLWILVVPTVSVATGLVVAVLADRLSSRWESISKSVIFLPMAISFVGASTIWGFVYAWRPAGRPQIGLLNQVWTSFGGEPVAWVSTTSINNYLLMIIMIWLQAGFSMVLLSAAIKNVPQEMVEAARVDGATEIQIFFRIIIPQIASTIAVVATTVVILVLKVFDIVYVMTNGNFGTEVVANRFIKEIFSFRQFGRAAAIVVVLMLLTVPVMIANVRRFRVQEATR